MDQIHSNPVNKPPSLNIHSAWTVLRAGMDRKIPMESQDSMGNGGNGGTRTLDLTDVNRAL